MKIQFKKSYVWLTTIVVIGVIAGSWYYYARRGAETEQFMTGKVERGDLRNTVSATGTLQAVTTVQVGSQVSGRISALFADFNTQVKQGQIVAQLDPSIFEAQVASARANLEQAQASLADARARVLAMKATIQNLQAGVSSANANLLALKAQMDDAQSLLKRQESLAESGVVPERDLESARTAFKSAEARYKQALAQVEQARVSEQSSATAGAAQAEAQVKQAEAQVKQNSASLKLAEVNLSHTTIRSPIDGVVVSRNVDVGQTVAASLSAPTLFTIANDLTQMQVIANIDQADIGAINRENRVTFTVDAYLGRQFSGTIKEVRLNPQNVQNVVTYNVVINVQNPDLKLMPGMTTNLTFAVAERKGVLKVPNAALRFTPKDMTPEKIRELLRQRAGVPSAEGTPGEATARQREGREGRQRANANAGEGAAEGQSRIVWLLGAGGNPEPRRIKLGITDGSATEVLSGDLREGDPIIVGQKVTDNGSGASASRPPGFGGGGFGGGGRR